MVCARASLSRKRQTGPACGLATPSRRVRHTRGRGPRTMLLTIWCVVSVLASMLALGVPLRWLLNHLQPLGKVEWLEAPVLGAAAAMLALHNLIYFDVPIHQAAP